MKEPSLREKYLKLLGKACKNRSLKKYATDFFDDLCRKYEGRVFKPSDFATQIVDDEEFRQDVVVDLVERQGGATMPEIYVYLFEKNVKKIKFHKKFEGAVDGDNDFVSKKVRIKTSSIKEHYKPQKVMPRSVAYSPDMPKAEYDRLCRMEAKKAKKAQQEENKRAWRMAVKEWKEGHRHVMYHELAHVDELETYGGRRFVGNHFCSDERFVREHENKYQLASPSLYISSAELDEEEFDDKKQLPIDQVLTGLIRQGKVAISEIFNEEFACEVEGTLKLTEPQRLVMEITPENQTIFYGRKRELAGNCDYNRNYDFACMTRALMGDLDFKGARFNSKEAIRRINNANIDMEFVRSRIGEMLDKAISLAPPPEKVPVFKANGKKEELTLRSDAEIFEYFKSKLCDMNFYQALCLCFGAPTIAQKSSCKAYQDFLAPEVRKLTQEILIEAIRGNLQRDIQDPDVPKDEAFFKRLDQTLTTIDNFVLYRYDDVRLRVEGEKEEKYFKSTSLYPSKKLISLYPEEEHLASFAKLIEEAEAIVQENPENVDNLHMDFFANQLEITEKYQEIQEIHDAIVAKEDKERMERIQRQYEEAIERERLWREEWEIKHSRKVEEEKPQIEEETMSAEDGDDENELF